MVNNIFLLVNCVLSFGCGLDIISHVAKLMKIFKTMDTYIKNNIADNKNEFLSFLEYYRIARAPFLALCEKWVTTREKKL